MDPEKLFYSGTDGFSLKTLLAKCEGNKPTIMLLKTTHGNPFVTYNSSIYHHTGAIIGAFLTDEWKLSPKNYYGDGDSFVFTLAPKERKYDWTARCSFFTMITEKFLSIGGGKDGKSAIYLDTTSLMSGKSQRSETFGNDILTGNSSEDFSVSSIEIYSFV